MKNFKTMPQRELLAFTGEMVQFFKMVCEKHEIYCLPGCTADYGTDFAEFKFSIYHRVKMKNKCSKCDSQLSYSKKWDSYYCRKCNEWKESHCREKDCWFHCQDRPDRPRKVKGETRFPSGT